MAEREFAEIVLRAEELLGSRIVDVGPLPGGHSGLTLVGELDPPFGRHQRVVVKATPPGRRPIGRHDVMRQVRGMEIASPAVPVPEVLATSDDPPLFVMSFEHGEAAEPAHDEAPSGDDEVLVQRRFAVATELLAELHGVALPTPVGPSDPFAEVVTPRDELAKWERTLNAVDGIHRDMGTVAFDALSSSIPEPGPPVLVHGDFRLGNILFDHSDAVAVIDWEIWSIGDARVDLGWYLTFCDPGNFPGIGYPGRRLPALHSIVDAYEGSTGRRVDGLEWFLAFGAFKIGVVMAHNLGRHRSGRHVDSFQERLPPTIDRLLRQAAVLPDLDRSST